MLRDSTYTQEVWCYLEMEKGQSLLFDVPKAP